MDDALRSEIARREDAIARVTGILTGVLQVNRSADAIDLDAPLFGSGIGLDSVDALELVIAIEAEFALSLEEQRFRTSLRTLNSLVDLILAERPADSVTL